MGRKMLLLLRVFFLGTALDVVIGSRYCFYHPEALECISTAAAVKAADEKEELPAVIRPDAAPSPVPPHLASFLSNLLLGLLAVALVLWSLFDILWARPAKERKEDEGLLATALANLQREQEGLEAEAAGLAEQLEQDGRKREFSRRWVELCRSKKLLSSQLLTLLDEAKEVKSEFEAVIEEFLEFRQKVDRESSTLRVCGGEDSLQSLTRSGELSLLTTSYIAEEEAKREAEEEEEKEGHDESEREADESEEISLRVSTRRGERSEAKRRSRKGPMGVSIFDDYGAAMNEVSGSLIASELAQQNMTEINFRSIEFLHNREIALRKLQQADQRIIWNMQKEQEKQEERRRQEYENLKQRKEKNQVLKQELELKKQQELQKMAEANKQREFNYLLMKLFLHAFIHGMCAVFSLWRTLEASWHATLDFSSFCMPFFFGKICLPNLAYHLNLFPAALFFAVIALWSNFYIQIPSGLALAYLAWSKVNNLYNFWGLLVVSVIQSGIYFCSCHIRNDINVAAAKDGRKAEEEEWKWHCYLPKFLEVLLFLVSLYGAYQLFCIYEDSCSSVSCVVGADGFAYF